MPIYNKLIRDRILEIIEKDSKTYDMEILSKEHHEEEIKAKLTEEVQEYQATQNDQDALEELADILELIHAALPLHNATFNQLEEIGVNKKNKCGGFDKGLYLIEVHEKINDEVWLDEIIKVIKFLGGTASLADIYKIIEIRRRFNLEMYIDWKSRIRKVIYLHSSDADIFKGNVNKPNSDIFYSVKGKGSGVWGIREY